MRGTHYPRVWWGWRVGIIPADAGNTTEGTGTGTATGDHPRGCGEHG